MVSLAAMAVGLLIKRLRQERGWSAQRLADECSRLGTPSLTRGTIAKIEAGVRKSVTAEEVGVLATAFGVPVSTFLSTQGNRAGRQVEGNDSWRVRVFGRDGMLRGAGVLLPEMLVLTSAHVISDIYASQQGADEHRPGDSVLIDFPGSADQRRCLAQVASDGWIPAGDIAILEIEGVLPGDVRSAEIEHGVPKRSASVLFFGYPPGSVEGVWAGARVLGPGGKEGEWIQLDGISVTGDSIGAGFSGAGVVDEASGAVIGMLVAADASQTKGPAWVAPTGTLERYWPRINRFVRPAAIEQRVLHDRYRLLTRLGAGGMGRVWLAEDVLLERAVALKELVQDGAAPDPAERRARALREARALARVAHPAIVSVHDIFFSGDDLWMVMEYIPGRSLDRIIKDYPLDERAIAKIGLPVLRGLIAVHRANVVHRDIKPANIVVADDGSVFLVDFGIAELAGKAPLTRHQNVVGTLEFLAPERILGQHSGPAADLWSLGVTLFNALEGYSPFQRNGERSTETTAMAILHDDPPRPVRQGQLAEVILRLLRKDPAQRAEATELASVLQSILDQSATPVPGPQRTAAKLPYTPDARPGGVALSRSQLADAREAVQNAGIDAGAALLLSMPDENAAQILADYPPRTVGELIQAIATARPKKAGTIMEMFSAGAAGRVMDYLSPSIAASILTAISSGEAARILGRADIRTVAGVITELPIMVSTQLIRAMPDKRAAYTLAHVKPTTVAALLLTAPDDLNRMLLGQFSPSFRKQVTRHLGGLDIREEQAAERDR